MQVLDIDGLVFTFPDEWKADKFDDWTFYRGHFARQRDGIKAVDAIAIGPNKTAFMIEVKDYRHPDTEKPSQLPSAIADKVLFTLAALLPAKLNATDPNEKRLAAAMLKCISLHVVAHIELSPRHRPVVDPADLKQKLRQLLRAVDAHAKVVSKQNMQGVGWTVS